MAKKRFVKFLTIFLCIIIFIILAWTALSLIGRVKADAVIPETAVFRISISNPIRLIDGILSHEPLREIEAISLKLSQEIPALAVAAESVHLIKENPLLKNRFVRLLTRGNIEVAMLASQTSPDNSLLAVWDTGLLSPVFRLRIAAFISRFVNVQGLYYVQAGRSSRFELRTPEMTLYIGPYRNLLFITSCPKTFEARTSLHEDTANGRFNVIRPSAFHAAFLFSPYFINSLLSEQDPAIAAVLNNIDIHSVVEAGVSIHPRKIELRLTAPLSSHQPALNRLLEQRSAVPSIAELLPASTQYATILSAGTLQELFQAALVFSGPDFEDNFRRADSASRTLLRLSLDDLLFSWSGTEFAVFGLEGRPHPVYAIQIADERRRQEVFERAFRSIVLTENVRLNLDGVRVPQIEVPQFLQSLLQRWNIFLPSPFYIIHRDYLLVSESAEALLSALRAMQRNDVLPRTAAWRNIAGGRPAASAFSLYYSLDLAVPFFLRNNTVLSSFLGIYREGLVRLGFNTGAIGFAGGIAHADISLVLIPGSGSGVTLISALPIEARGRLSNRVHGSGFAASGVGAERRIFLSAGDTVFSIDPSDNSIHEFSAPGQGNLWIIPAEGVENRNNVNAWIVSDRGRVTLTDGNLEPAQGFPLLTGLRLSSPPAAYNGRLYLCDEDGRIHVIDANGVHSVWETSFFVPVRSPPSFLTITTRGGFGASTTRSFAAVYPRSFFGELWLFDTDGNVLPNWPVGLSIDNDDDFTTGIGFGSPLLFAHNNRVLVAFVCQAGYLFVFNENASPVFPFPIALDGVFFQQPVFDGTFFWLACSEGFLFRVSLNGEVLYHRIANFSVREEGHITVFDSDGSGVPDVFITGEGNALHAFTRNFRSLDGFPLPMWGMPYFAPQDRSRNAEIFGMGMNRRLYRWQFR